MTQGSNHELQQLLLSALIQVGLLDGNQLTCGSVAGHTDQTQVVEASPWNTHDDDSDTCSW